MNSAIRQAGAADLRSLWFSFINVSLREDTVKQQIRSGGLRLGSSRTSSNVRMEDEADAAEDSPGLPKCQYNSNLNLAGPFGGRAAAGPELRIDRYALSLSVALGQIPHFPSGPTEVLDGSKEYGSATSPVNGRESHLARLTAREAQDFSPVLFLYPRAVDAKPQRDSVVRAMRECIASSKKGRRRRGTALLRLLCSLHFLCLPDLPLASRVTNRRISNRHCGD